ncbi:MULTISPECIES: hypothetical protein [Streptomyces]|uniref:hypothetical protein n=1 Tax=Streptomyces TaxID=1883 RepID=UPI0038631B50
MGEITALAAYLHGRWLGAHSKWTTGIAIADGALALVLWNYSTSGVVVLVLLGILAAASGTAGHANADDQRVIPYG